VLHFTAVYSAMPTLMCLILLANRALDEVPLVVAANRDEFYARPAAPAHRWRHAPAIFGGMDLEAGGTWLAVSERGRFAAVTNFTETIEGLPPPGSRGALPKDFLEGGESAEGFAARIEHDRYRGFNLLLFDGQNLVYTSNRHPGITTLAPGVYGLANTHLGSHWPKVETGACALERALHDPRILCRDLEPLLDVLADDTVPPDHELPQRGRDVALERRVAPRFIRGEEYGTRASTALVMTTRRIHFHERLFGPNGKVLGETRTTL